MKDSSIINYLCKSEDNTNAYDKFYSNTIKSLNIDEYTVSDILSMLNKDNYELFNKIESEIDNEHVNYDHKIHGPRHIKDVLLYSILLNSNLFSDKHNLELLAYSAKYHDVARDSDGNEEHAIASANVVPELLNGKYSPEDIAKIQALIAFHEVDRRRTNLDYIFREICMHYGVNDKDIDELRKYAEILKDADALDRTRFVNRARLNPYMLYYLESQKFIKVASCLQETYALSDLKKYNADEDIDIILSEFTPQETLRFIRRNTKYMNDDEIKEFIHNDALNISKSSRR